MSSTALTFNDGGGEAPFAVQLAPSQDLRPQVVCAAWDGTGASGSFLACLSLYSQSGVLISRTAPPVTFAAGDTGVVTYAPFLGREEQVSPPVVGGSWPFTVLQLDGSVNVFVWLDTDAPGTPTAITDNADGGTLYDDAYNPVPSPDGTMVAFSMVPVSVGFPAIYTVPMAAGSTPTQVAADGSNYLMYPMWSPDGSTLVFCYGAGGVLGGRIVSMPAGGGTITTLYTPAAGKNCFRPAFNHDGTKIAFMLDTNIGAGTGLIVMNADGTGATQIATIQGYRFDGGQFGWANGSDVLAYDDGASSCYVINADGTGQTLVNTGSLSGVPVRCPKTCWSSDDSEVIVTVFSGFRWDLWSLAPDGSGVTQLTSGNGGANQGWMKQAQLWNGRRWFIEGASSTNQGLLSSTLPDGTDYVQNMNLLDGSVGDFFYGGTGFEWN